MYPRTPGGTTWAIRHSQSMERSLNMEAGHASYSKEAGHASKLQQHTPAHGISIAAAGCHVSLQNWVAQGCGCVINTRGATHSAAT
mmetsp:Transcript_12648/g.27358  ORF Transcript_12648/g.27358 Transcript_12648/m.27358 type:complete len:86 (+) Transcript_12648:281-538(+)